eukprot:3681336-Alexandrium_andersonii.AAC.1
MPPPPVTPTRSAKLTPRRDGPDPSGAVAGQRGQSELRRARHASERIRPALGDRKKIKPPTHW